MKNKFPSIKRCNLDESDTELRVERLSRAKWAEKLAEKLECSRTNRSHGPFYCREQWKEYEDCVKSEPDFEDVVGGNNCCGNCRIYKELLLQAKKDKG